MTPSQDADKIIHKAFSFELKEADLAKSEFVGFAAGIGNRDFGNDIIEPGAFDKTIRERVRARKVRLLDNHNSFSTRDVWGTMVEAAQVPVPRAQRRDGGPTHRLEARFEVSKADENAQVALGKIAERHLDQLSIGFRPIKVEFEADDADKDEDGAAIDPRIAWLMGDGVRRIKEIQLWETSLVIWAMNPEAQILGNSVDSLVRFAHKAAASGMKVDEDTVRETIEALQMLTSSRCPATGPDAEVRSAVAEVRGVLDRLEDVVSPDAEERLRVLYRDFTKAHGKVHDDPTAEFVSWVVDHVPGPGDDDDDDEAAGAEPGAPEGKEDDVEDQIEEGGAEELEAPPADAFPEEGDDVEEEDTQDTAPADDEESSLEATVRGLREVVDKLADALGAAATDGEEADEAEDPVGGHAEEDEEAAKDTDAGQTDVDRAEHFPDGDELALVMADLELTETELAL